MIKVQSLSKANTEALKGIAILAIVLHNFFHNLPPILGENEFTFDSGITYRYLSAIQQQPERIFRLLFSYFGHMGVQIFIFLSAYGLTRKYLSQELRAKEFFRNRFCKIYLPFLLCVVVYVLLGLLKQQFVTEKVLMWESLLWKVLLISNFLPDQAALPVGPWWFIPFIFQFYALYPLLLAGYRRHGYKILLLISVLAILFEWLVNPVFLQYHVDLNRMVFGHLALFCFGLFCATQETMRLRPVSVVLSGTLFLLGNFFVTPWMVIDIAFVVITIALANPLFRLLNLHRVVRGALEFLGKVSFYLFMVNGFLRSFFSSLAVSLDTWWGDYSAALLSLGFSTLCAYCLQRLDTFVRARIRCHRASA